MEHRTDAELVAQVLGGDKEAFGELVERYQEMVERIARKMIADEWIVHELVQEAFLQAYLSLKYLRDASRFKSWLYGITLNICRSYLQDQKADMLPLETIMGGVRSDFVTSFGDVVDPQTIAEAHDFNRAVMNAIADLSTKDKEATLLFYYEQLTLQEIAALSGVSIGAIKGRLYRARKQLQERLPMEYVPERRKKQRKINMRQVTIDAVRSHADTKQSFVILKDGYDASLVIWIGKAEALTIVAGLSEITPPRPMAVHLMASFFDVTGIRLKEVRVEACKNDIFYAVIAVSNGNEEYELDARPSDALALAVLMKCPIFVSDILMENAKQASPFKEIGLSTQFREVNQDMVVNEYKEQTENFLQFFASLTRTNLELELQKEKEEREKTNQEFISSWKEDRKRNQLDT